MAWHRFAGDRRRPRRAARVSPGWPPSAPTRSPPRTPDRRTCRRRRRRRRCSPSCRSAPAPSTSRPGWRRRSSTPCTDRGIPALGIWAQVPHYVATMSYPAASVALLEGLATATGITDRRRRAAPRGGAAARAARPARRRQRRAPGDGRPVRAAVRRRRGGRGERGRRRTPDSGADGRSSCAPATSSPPRSSASCATRARADRRRPIGRAETDATRSTLRSSGHEGRRRHRQHHRPRPAPRPPSSRSAGYSGGWTAETSHDPFLPLLLAAEHTTELELGTSIAVAFARNPMTLANTAWDLQIVLARAASSSASAARSSRTSRSASRWSGATRRRGCGR